MSSTTVDLARFEGGRLLRNPLLWLSLVPVALWVNSTLGTDPGGEGAENQYLLLVGFSVVVPGVVIVGHVVLAVLRARVSGADWLLDAVPVGRDRVTVGYGLSTVAAGAVGLIVIVATYLVVLPGRTLGSSADMSAEFPRPNVAQMLQGPMAMIVLGTFAIALVRWIPSWLVLIPVAVWLLLVQGVFAGIFFGVPTTRQSWWLPLSTGVVHGEWIGCGEDGPECVLPISGFDSTTAWWHLIYLVALALLFVVAAVVRHRRDQLVWIALVAAVAAVAGSAIVQAAVFQQYEPSSVLR